MEKSFLWTHEGEISDLLQATGLFLGVLPYKLLQRVLQLRERCDRPVEGWYIQLVNGFRMCCSQATCNPTPHTLIPFKTKQPDVFVLVKWSHMIQIAAKANKCKANTCRLGQIPEFCSKCTLSRHIFQLYSHKTPDNFQALTQSSPMESSHKRQDAQIWASRTLRERGKTIVCALKIVILGARVHNVSFTVFIL